MDTIAPDHAVRQLHARHTRHLRARRRYLEAQDDPTAGAELLELLAAEGMTTAPDGATQALWWREVVMQARAAESARRRMRKLSPRSGWR